MATTSGIIPQTRPVSSNETFRFNDSQIDSLKAMGITDKMIDTSVFVTGQYPGCSVVNGSNEPSTPTAANVRGIVLTTDGQILTAGSPHPQTLVVDGCQVDEKQIHFTFEGQVLQSFDLDSTAIRPMYPGVFLRVIYFPPQDGRPAVTGIFTHRKKIDGTKSRFDVSNPTTFMDMWARTGFPSLEELAKIADDESVVIGVHLWSPELANTSQQDTDRTFAAVLDCDNPRVESYLKQHFNDLPPVPDTVVEDGVYSYPTLPAEKVDSFLKYGYWPAIDLLPPLLRKGESVMVDSGGMLYKVVSTASLARDSVRGGTPNLYQAFLRFMAEEKTPENYPVPPLEKDQMEQMGVLSFTEATVHPEFSHFGQKLAYYDRVLHTAFVLSLAPCNQSKAFDFLERRQAELHSVWNSLVAIQRDVYQKHGQITAALLKAVIAEAQVHKSDPEERRNQIAVGRCVDIILRAVQGANDKRTKQRKPIFEIIKNTIRSYLNVEREFYTISRFFGLHDSA